MKKLNKQIDRVHYLTMVLYTKALGYLNNRNDYNDVLDAIEDVAVNIKELIERNRFYIAPMLVDLFAEIMEVLEQNARDLFNPEETCSKLTHVVTKEVLPRLIRINQIKREFYPID